MEAGVGGVEAFRLPQVAAAEIAGVGRNRRETAAATAVAEEELGKGRGCK
jgi:hypothetical protein